MTATFTWHKKVWNVGECCRSLISDVKAVFDSFERVLFCDTKLPAAFKIKAQPLFK